MLCSHSVAAAAVGVVRTFEGRCEDGLLWKRVTVSHRFQNHKVAIWRLSELAHMIYYNRTIRIPQITCLSSQLKWRVVEQWFQTAAHSALREIHHDGAIPTPITIGNTLK